MYTKKVIDGYYPTVVTYDKRLQYCPYGSAGVIFSDGSINLISYTTRVCSIFNGEWLVCYGTFSATTRKHIGAFIKEYAPNCTYYDAKFCYQNNVALNILTGECIDL